MPTAEDEDGRQPRWPVGGGEPPYFWGTWRDADGATVAGDGACELGRRHRGTDGRPSGVYARWSWDGETLTAEVDPLGYFNLFVFAEGTTVGVSPSLLQLVAAGADTTLDHRALGVFFRLGMFINEDTPFAHVHVLPPGGHLRWRAGQLEITGAPFVPEERSITRREAVDAFISLTRQAVGEILRAWPDEILLPLSGGRDSRHILLEMCRLGRPPRACVTFHHEGARLNAEAQAARAICERVGVTHTVLGHPRPRAKDVLRALVLTSLCSDEHAQMMPLHDYLMGRPVAALDGIAGDILSNPDDWAEEFFQRAARRDFTGIARRMMQGHAAVVSRREGGAGAGPLYAKGREDESVEYVGAAIARLAHAADPYQAFWFWHRTRREIGFVPTSILGSARAVFCPYLDPQLVELGLSLPYRVTRDQLLHDEALSKAHPTVRDVPFQEGFAEPRARRTRPWRKLGTAVDGLGALLAVRPERPIREVLAHLRGSRALRRAPGELYRLYTLCLEGLDADKAKRLLSTAAALESARPRALITETFIPRIHPTADEEAA